MTARRSLCVLLVEDQNDTLALMARLLKGDGHTVHTARSAQEASDLAAQNKCDLLISDIGLPDRSGLELMRELRSMYALKGIAVSGWASKEDAQAALDAGFIQHLAKPFDYKKLVEAIQAATAHGSS